MGSLYYARIPALLRERRQSRLSPQFGRKLLAGPRTMAVEPRMC
jgi:hypothetical protein